MKTNIPIYRAKKIDSDKYVEGYLIVQQSKIGIYYFIYTEITIDRFEIDKSTLEISFNNGTTWNTIDDVASLVACCEYFDGKTSKTMELSKEQK